LDVHYFQGLPNAVKVAVVALVLVAVLALLLYVQFRSSRRRD
jgi:hypothetical protein